MESNTCIRQQADGQQIDRCRKSIREQEAILDQYASALELAGNKVRLKILYLLYNERQLCVCDLSDILGMNISAVSQHLRKLKDRQFITMHRKAQTIFYNLTPAYESVLSPVFTMISHHQIISTDAHR